MNAGPQCYNARMKTKIHDSGATCANPNAPAILRLMQRGSRVLGLRLCFHDQLRRSGLAGEWTQHTAQPCARAKKQDPAACSRFGGQEVHRALAGMHEGRIQCCPFGFTEIAVPVFSDNLPAGVLFAGPCWMRRSAPPHPGLIVPPGRGWLEDRLIMLKALATELGRLLMGERSHVPEDRRRMILRFIFEHMEGAVTLPELAASLNLSSSRTGHLVRELFGVTFPDLVQRVKLTEAANLLATTDHPIGMVAAMVGYNDQNYFSRTFSRRFSVSPREFRKRYPAEA